MGIHLEAYCLRNSLRHSLNLVLGFKFPLRRLNPKASGQDKNYQTLIIAPSSTLSKLACSFLLPTGRVYGLLLILPLYHLFPRQMTHLAQNQLEDQNEPPRYQSMLSPNTAQGAGAGEIRGPRAGKIRSPVKSAAWDIRETQL